MARDMNCMKFASCGRGFTKAELQRESKYLSNCFMS